MKAPPCKCIWTSRSSRRMDATFRLYLNAEVYTGTPQWSAAAEYAKKVMDAGFSLAPNYGDNFLADNNLPLRDDPAGFVMMAYRLALGPDCSLSPALSVVIHERTR